MLLHEFEGVDHGRYGEEIGDVAGALENEYLLWASKSR